MAVLASQPTLDTTQDIDLMICAHIHMLKSNRRESLSKKLIMQGLRNEDECNELFAHKRGLNEPKTAGRVFQIGSQFAWGDRSLINLIERVDRDKQSILQTFQVALSHSSELSHYRNELSLSLRTLKTYRDQGLGFIHYWSSSYPNSLRALQSPPSILYYRGDISKLQLSSGISVVGTRKASLYGKHSTRALVQALAQYQTCIVSGLAAGIDSEAHIAAIENNIPTVAVLGCGVLKAPRASLIKAMLNQEHNLVISEFEPKDSAQAWTFASRNRIIAALTKASIVIEAGKGSGSLITANFAQQLKKPVYALSADLSKESFAGNMEILSQAKAKPIFDIKALAQDLDLPKLKQEDVLERKLSDQAGPNQSGLSSYCKQILSNISADPVSFDALKQELNINQISLSTNLSMLEIQGFIKRLPNSLFVLAQ